MHSRAITRIDILPGFLSCFKGPTRTETPRKRDFHVSFTVKQLVCSRNLGFMTKVITEPGNWMIFEAKCITKHA